MEQDEVLVLLLHFESSATLASELMMYPLVMSCSCPALMLHMHERLRWSDRLLGILPDLPNLYKLCHSALHVWPSFDDYSCKDQHLRTDDEAVICSSPMVMVVFLISLDDVPSQNL